MASKPGTRFVLLFFLFASIGFALLWMPALIPSLRSFTYAITAFSGAVIKIGGGSVGIAGDIMAGSRDGFTMRVANGCNGINVIVLLWSAILAWPAGAVAKFKGIVWGALILQAANTLRIISLFYLGQWNRDWFEWMHLYVWEVLLMILGTVIFAWWIRRAAAPAGSHPGK